MSIAKKGWMALLAMVLVCCNACKADSKQKVTTSQTALADSGSVLSYKVREANGNEKPVLLILMHGFGSDENDLLSLSVSFPNNYIVVTPQGPYQIGPENYKWYTSTKDTHGNLDANPTEIASSIAKVTSFIKQMQDKYQVPPERTFVGGFSQGATMSYELGLHTSGLFRGIGVFSGLIFDSLKKEKTQIKADSLQIFIGHGEADSRLPYIEAEKSSQWLIAHQYKPEFHTYKGMIHAISPEEVDDFLKFTQKNL